MLCQRMPAKREKMILGRVILDIFRVLQERNTREIVNPKLRKISKPGRQRKINSKWPPCDFEKLKMSAAIERNVRQKRSCQN